MPSVKEIAKAAKLRVQSKKKLTNEVIGNVENMLQEAQKRFASKPGKG